jgi:hypothetical protein
MPRRAVRTLAQDDLQAAKTSLNESCPFCDFVSRSDNVRRHVQRFHPDPAEVIDKELSNGMTYNKLDAEHPHIVLTGDGPDDLYVKHQAYCYGCHHRIVCKSKTLERAMPDCMYHKCKAAAKPRGPRTAAAKEAGAEVMPTPVAATGPDWRAICWDLAKDRRLGGLADELRREEADLAEQSDDDDDDEDAAVDYRQVLVAKLVLQSTSEKRVAKEQELTRAALSRAQAADDRATDAAAHHQELMRQKDDYIARLRAEMDMLRAALAEATKEDEGDEC